MLTGFRARFGRDATRIVRAPGRVNLVGEHVDYAGLPVLPVALGRSVWIASRPAADDRVRVHSLDPAFPAREFQVAPDIPPSGGGDWGDYVKAAAVEVAAAYGVRRGADLLVTADLQAAAGLSSSSALVVASALALLAGSGIAAGRLDLAERLAEAERYVGTRGGGMDQAVCLGARFGHAARISFDPLRIAHLRVPPDWRLVVAFSLAPARKSAGARERYNRLRSEVEAATAALAGRLGLESLPATAAALLAAAGRDAVREALGADPPVQGAGGFRHVLAESARVAEAEEALRDRDIARFGRLMDASHASLRDGLGVSTPELDAIVEIAREAGAAGARLTGAGMGGSAVALCSAARAADVRAALAERFYAGRVSGRAVEDVLFEAVPGAGARVRRL
ncbi:MAG: galactokinase family protein [Gemmatimonadota bacterium]|nr:galactokinase family protein [Gemmatimonadota bacterium]